MHFVIRCCIIEDEKNFLNLYLFTDSFTLNVFESTKSKFSLQFNFACPKKKY